MTCIEQPITPTLEPARMPWARLAVLSLGAFWTVTLEMLPAGLLLTMSADLGVRPSLTGLLVTVWALCVGLTSLPMTRATRRWRRTTALAAGLGLLGVATLASAVVPTFAGVLVLRLIAATGHGLFWSVLMVYAASIAPRGREGRAIATVLAGPVLAGVAGLPLCTRAAEAFGWRPVTAGIALGLLLGSLLVGRSQAAAATSDAPRGSDPTARLVWLTAIIGALALVGHFVVFTFVAELARGRWGLGGYRLGSVLLVFGVAGAAGLVVIALVGDRAPRGSLLGVVGGLVLVLGVLAIGRNPALTTPAIAVWGLLVGALPPALQNAVLAEASPAYQQTAGAVLVTVFNLGVAGGAALGGVLLDLAGPDLLPAVAAAVLAVSVTGLWTLWRRRPAGPRPA